MVVPSAQQEIEFEEILNSSPEDIEAASDFYDRMVEGKLYGSVENGPEGVKNE